MPLDCPDCKFCRPSFRSCAVTERGDPVQQYRQPDLFIFMLPLVDNQHGTAAHWTAIVRKEPLFDATSTVDVAAGELERRFWRSTGVVSIAADRALGGFDQFGGGRDGAADVDVVEEDLPRVK